MSSPKSLAMGLTHKLFTMKCFLCYEADRDCPYTMLPLDCITAPVISLCFRDEEGKPSAIEMRYDEGGRVEVFVLQSAVIKADTTRHNNLTKHPVYKKGKQFFYRVDDDLIGRLKSKQSKVAAYAVKRLETLRLNVDLNKDAMITAYAEKMNAVNGGEDVEKIVSILDWCMRSLGEKGVLQQVYEAQGKAYGISSASTFVPDVEHPNCKIYECRGKEFWDNLMVEGRKYFGVKDPDQFKRDQVLGKRRRLATENVPHRPYFNKYYIHFPDSDVWTHDQDCREWATINRILWEAEHIDPEAASAFSSTMDADILAAIGYSRPYVIRIEKTERKGGRICHIGAFDFLRFGFYAAVIYLCTHQTDNLRRALMEKNKSSLTTKLLQCHLLTESERKEVGFLNLAYERLCQSATRNISVKQISVTAFKQGLPSAFVVLRFMYKLDTQCTSPQSKMLLCFLALAYFCGFRSSDMGRLMVPSYKVEHMGHHNLLVSDDKTGEMWLGSTKCKTVADDIKVLLFPNWLKKWVDDYVEIRGTMVPLTPAEGDTEGEHGGMWFTTTGNPVHKDAGAKAYRNYSEFDYIFKQLKLIGGDEMAKVTCYTDLRSIFFDGSSVDVSGSMMNLFANAQEYLPKNEEGKPKHGELRTDVQLTMQDDIKKAMEELNRSKSQAVYTRNRKAPLPFVADYYNAVKEFVWAIL